MQSYAYYSSIPNIILPKRGCKPIQYTHNNPKLFQVSTEDSQVTITAVTVGEAIVKAHDFWNIHPYTIRSVIYLGPTEEEITIETHIED